MQSTLVKNNINSRLLNKLLRTAGGFNLPITINKKDSDLEIILGTGEHELSLNPQTAQNFWLYLTELIKNKKINNLNGWRLNIFSKNKIILYPPIKLNLNSLEDIHFDKQSKQELYETILDGRGVIILGGQNKVSQELLAKAIMNFYTGGSHSLLVISKQSNKLNTEAHTISPENILANPEKLKNYDADLVYWATELPSKLDFLLKLGEQKLIIINDAAGSYKESLTNLTSRVDHQELLQTLKHIINTEVIERICANCQKAYTAKEHEVIDLSDWLNMPAEALYGNKFYYGQGCANCDHTGQSGHHWLGEILPLKNLNNFSKAGIKEFLTNPPAKTWRELAVEAALAGHISLEELKKHF